MLAIPASSEAGEQPYDDQGILGAYNRINNSLLELPDHLPTSGDGEVGTVIVGAVENFIHRSRDPVTNRETAVDYGAVMLYNATSGELKMGVSAGTTVPTEYWKEAETYGFEDEDGERKQGKVTVGEVLAAHFEGQLDKADWHKVLSVGKVSRYELLRDALEAVGVPWGGKKNDVHYQG